MVNSDHTLTFSIQFVIKLGKKAPPSNVANLSIQLPLLFLPVAFNVESHDFIKYSLPAKSAAYMASGTPMLVYAPADLPIATEAVHYGIAHVVSEQDIGQLTEGAYHMLCDQEARAAVSEAALGRVREAYNRPIIQERTRQLFVEAILRHGNGTV